LPVSNSSTAGPYLAVLTNGSNQPITAIAVRWIIEDASEKSNLSTVRTDGYGSTKPFALVAGKGQLAITPTQFMAFQEPGVPAPHAIAARPDVKLMSQLDTASKITISIDAVIFANGKIVGPNKSNEAEYIRDRKAAANALVARVRDAIKDRTDVSSLLKSVTPPLQLTPDNWFLFWTGQHARRLQTSLGKLEPLLDHLANLPDPPVFFHQ